MNYYSALGFFSKFKKTIAVAGTHGKTTITSLAGLLLEKAGLDPTVIVGGKVREFDGNFRAGGGEYLVTEADEYRRHFLALQPYIAIISNIEADHLDYYKDIEDITNAFRKFVSRVAKGGTVIVNAHNTRALALSRSSRNRKIITFALQDADIQAKNISCEPDKTSFYVLSKNTGREYKTELKVPGMHNILNSLAIFALAEVLNIPESLTREVLSSFSGTWRRFEIKGKLNGITVIDDYAHHPSEIRATLLALRQKYVKEKIWLVFQPHLYSRTRILMDDFAKSFQGADQVIITDIYAAREKDDLNTNAVQLVQKAKAFHPKVRYCGDFKEIIKLLKIQMPQNSVLVTMGAGDVFKIGEEFLKV